MRENVQINIPQYSRLGKLRPGRRSPFDGAGVFPAHGGGDPFTEATGLEGKETFFQKMMFFSLPPFPGGRLLLMILREKADLFLFLFSPLFQSLPHFSFPLRVLCSPFPRGGSDRPEVR